MTDHIKRLPEQILSEAKTILLVDWPNVELPSALLSAGFTVFSYSPDSYSEAKLVKSKPDGKDFSTLKNGDGEVYLIFQKSDNLTAIDIVNIYRPETELADIVEKHILPLGAKILWLHPPLTSELARGLAAQHCLEFVQGVSIADVATEIKSKTIKS